LWRKVLLEKLTVTQLVKKVPAWYRTRRFITLFTRACHWSLSWDGSGPHLPTLFPQDPF